MRKIAIIVFAICFIASPLFAASITDSVKPLGHLKYSLTAEDNYIFRRDIKSSESNTNKTEDINQVYAKLALGLTPYFNVYTKLGVSNGGKIKDTNVGGGGNSQQITIETDYGFLAGLGVSGAKEISGGWKVGADVQFNWWTADVDTVTPSYASAKATGVSGKIQNIEWQATPFVTRKIDISQYNWVMNPYLGVKFSSFTTGTDKPIKYTSGSSNSTSWALRGKDYIGLVVGSDLEFADKWALQLEGRFIDETAIAGGATYRF